MVPTLSSSEKLKTEGGYILGLFGSGPKSSVGGQATNITLKGHEPVLPRAAKITFIVPMDGIKETFP